jgi:hypothetical protein
MTPERKVPEAPAEWAMTPERKVPEAPAEQVVKTERPGKAF